MNNVGHLWLSLLTSWPLSSREWAPTTPNCCVHQHLEPINWWNKCIVKQNYIPSSDWLCLWCSCSSAMLSEAPKRNPAVENGTGIIDVISRLRLKKTEFGRSLKLLNSHRWTQYGLQFQLQILSLVKKFKWIFFSSCQCIKINHHLNLDWIILKLYINFDLWQKIRRN